MTEDGELSKIAGIAVKLLYMQTKPRVEQLKKELLKTLQQKKAYEALDGKRGIKQVAEFAGYTDSRTLETILPVWESKGLILSVGKGSQKRYLSIENLEL